MPKVVERCVKEVKKKGHSSSSSWAICNASHNKKMAKEKMHHGNKGKSRGGR